jgi:hypothetical protein
MKLGRGGEGPWEDRSEMFIKLARSEGNKDVVAGHLNRDYAVQRRQYVSHPGIDLLTVMRHDKANQHPGWAVLQSIKNKLAPDGTERFGMEVFPPARFVIDNSHLWHVWVMPLGWEPGFGFHSDQKGGGLKI